MVTDAEMQNAAATLSKGISERSGPALSERDLTRYVIRFANGAALEGPLAAAPDVLTLSALAPVGQTQSPRAQYIERHRAELRKHLAAGIAKGPFPHTLFLELRAAALQMVDCTRDFIQEHSGRPRRVSIRSPRFYMPLSLSAVLAHAVLKLKDDSLGLGVDLKQCTLRSCNDSKPRFFFRSETRPENAKHPKRGRPREYCSDECTKKAHELTGPKRSREARARKTAKHK